MATPVYLQRYALPSRLHAPIPPRIDAVVVIPAYAEPDLTQALLALENCHTTGQVEVLVVLNSRSDDQPVTQRAVHKMKKDSESWNQSKHEHHYHFIHAFDLPAKKAGVGLARKIGMDEACRRLVTAGCEEAPIICFDADCSCDTNYLQTVIAHFKQHRPSPGASIYFEHPVTELDVRQRDLISLYEIWLRYYVQALRWAGYPYSFHTVGSAMAVRASAYMQQGGMNTRKAAEDFHFLHRIMPLGHFMDITDTTVYPSPRVSERVPFGTGKAMSSWTLKHESSLLYAPVTFSWLKAGLAIVPYLYNSDHPKRHLPDMLRKYLEQKGMKGELHRMRRQARNPTVFIKHFYQWLNGLNVLQWVHYCRDNGHPNVSVKDGLAWLLDDPGIAETGIEGALHRLRKRDKKSKWIS